MKRLQGDRDYLCIVGKSSEITTNLNKIGAIYDIKIHSATVKDDGIVMVIVERIRREDSPGTSGPGGLNL